MSENAYCPHAVAEVHAEMREGGKYGEVTLKYEAGKITRIIKTENIQVKA